MFFVNSVEERDAVIKFTDSIKIPQLPIYGARYVFDMLCHGHRVVKSDTKVANARRRGNFMTIKIKSMTLQRAVVVGG